MLDHLQRNTFDPTYISGIVLDEADKLLALGFEEQLKQIITYLPANRQNLLFSATFPPAVEQLVKAVLNYAVFIRTNAAANPDKIEFKAFRISAEAKPSLLLRLLSTLKQERIVIFCNTRERVDEIADLLKRQEFPVAGLHGAMDQPTRDQVMAKFRNGSISYLVATDLAARGLHIEELNVVIHLEILREEASFLHRSGRTGRAGKSGVVYLFLSETEEKYLQKWQQIKDIHWLHQKSLSETRTTMATTPEFITIHLKAGKKEKMSAGDIVGAILAKTQLQANQIGKIEIFDHFSYVAVPFEEGKALVDILNQVKIKGNKIRASLVK
ncbi:DEAD/DEAH box helicase [Rhodocytophaga rosea]|uniref:DEAD/DEAH box helicase n=1 Tax=Rhodocytophaga rosea TaxID=2704465 RepID=A0A6C0GP89_9BACT|nr:DEAD/DEAH box helicase [Rhodocytophaga rosea]